MSIDLQSCYTNIRLHKQFQPYCCICWKGGFYKFTRVPFGISCAPACCQELTRSFIDDPDLASVYLDDFLLVDGLDEKLKNRMTQLLKRLEQHRLPINSKKSILDPVTKLVYNGYHLDFEDKTVCTLPRHIQTLTEWIEQITVDQGATVSDWLSFKGLFAWCRSQRVDKGIEARLNEIGKGGMDRMHFLNLEAEDLELLQTLPARCSLPFDF